MVYYDIHIPGSLSGEQLDAYLGKGWYRMQQTIFTTDIIVKNDLLIPVFWLRLNLKKYKQGKSGQKIITQNKRFHVAITSGAITSEIENLYQLYRSAMHFELSETVKDYLEGEAPANIYATRCFEVRDGELLIAAGFFDEGDTSMAGILNMYHPAYAAYSLGKYLMLLKIGYALQHKKHYYYPGYISTAITKFDYKLFPDKEAAEVYLRNTDSWVPWLSADKWRLEGSLFGLEG